MEFAVCQLVNALNFEEVLAKGISLLDLALMADGRVEGYHLSDDALQRYLDEDPVHPRRQLQILGLWF